ncbi:MAG: Asp-tRNA(Asn)/Glu-tRNA(Gln) amidotransferase subunit GatA [Bacteroidia bacterium]|nr:Asp-tRNA(Asn)/Glu-tRNA(Gln) amidotransferase subunit GatA [Bacteroidia bacterium]MCX7764046.1 Asp-tRNA(Asn)/Glu-tRNA(Gln) amidotransferase subunit GatA [Bacteroidia bacterium]MDW8057075.1 Asp-tRNA(Asn)/Glu-tRNA(Gln) amidotransferase subunit GatA [Bacteroidia bacterium]
MRGSYTTLRQAVERGEATFTQAVEEFLERIYRENPRLNALLEVYENEALEAARRWDKAVQEGAALPPLAGLVYVHKDNIAVANHRLGAASRILEGYISPFDATVIERLKAAGAICIGRANCDEFAMGSSNENSAYGPVQHPQLEGYVPGGSSGGSAAAAAAGFCHVALGSDTGGSIRQPAAFCGLYGLKPTYGHVSRYGLIAYASSFDQIGPIAAALEDLIAVHQTIAGFDPKDATTASVKPEPFSPDLPPPKRWAFLLPEGLHPQVETAVGALMRKLGEAGFFVEQVGFPYWDYLIPTYYILTTAEASSNLSRYDGVRYGYRTKNPATLEALYARSRSEGFGREVKRRILLGTFVLSAGYYEAYYTRAQKVRRLLYDYTETLFQQYDVIAMPTSATPPFRLGEKTQDPIQMYLSDLLTVYANLTGHPALQIPIGNFVGLQVMGPLFTENRLFSAAYAVATLDK